MKKILLVLFVSLFPFIAFSQSAKYQYCEIQGVEKDGGLSVDAFVVYGALITNEPLRMIKDEKGNFLKFDTMVDAMNYMNLKGWELISCFVTKTDEMPKYIMQHWVLRKEISEETLKSIASKVPSFIKH